MKAGDIVEEKYELVRLLGKGGMGEVYEGRHLRIGRRVALKFLHPNLVSEGELVIRFLREAQVAATVGSEHIVDVFDLGETPEGTPFLVMEYLEGEDLGQVIRREQRLDPGRAVDLVIQACQGLEAAHTRGIIHRDLKPDNLFLAQREGCDEWVKIVDFGIAKFKSSLASTNPRLTETGVSLGTPFYMSPEQADGDSDLDHRTDIYSMGVILYELLTGRLPYDASSYNQLIVQLATGTPTPIREHRPDLPPELEEVILKAMARDPGRRFALIVELAASLRPFATLRSGSAEPSYAEPSPTREPGSALTRPARKAEPAPLPFSPTEPLPDSPPGEEQPAPSNAGEGKSVAWHSGSLRAFAGQTHKRSPRKIVTLTVLGSLVVGTATALVLVWFSGNENGPEGSPTAPTAPQVEPVKAPRLENLEPLPAAPEPDLVTVTLVDVPEGAQIYLDDLPVEGPELHLRRSPELRRLKVTLAGHPDWEQLIAADENRRLTVELPPAEPEARLSRGPGPHPPAPPPQPPEEEVPRIRTQFPGNGGAE